MQGKTGRFKRVLGKVDPGVTAFLGHERRDSSKLELIRTADGLTSCKEAKRKRLP
jgi:hypothetical protein